MNTKKHFMGDNNPVWLKSGLSSVEIKEMFRLNDKTSRYFEGTQPFQGPVL